MNGLPVLTPDQASWMVAVSCDRRSQKSNLDKLWRSGALDDVQYLACVTYAHFAQNGFDGNRRQGGGYVVGTARLHERLAEKVTATDKLVRMRDAIGAERIGYFDRIILENERLLKVAQEMAPSFGKSAQSATVRRFVSKCAADLSAAIPGLD